MSCILALALLAAALAVGGEKTYDPNAERVAVHLEAHADANELAAKHGFHNLGPVHGLEHHYVFQRLPSHEHRDDVDSSKHIGEHEHVKWWQVQTAKGKKRPLPNWNGEADRLAHQQQ